MKTPRKNKQWAKESLKSLEKAWEIARAENENLDHESLQYFYKYAPMLCAINRKIKNKNEISKLANFAIKNRLEDFEVEPETVENYSINFLLAYLDSHVSLGVISENKVFEIMDYIVDNYELEI